jgi:hypothetical protein
MRGDEQALLETLRAALRSGDWDLAFESAYWLASGVGVVPSEDTEDYIQQFDEQGRDVVGDALCFSFWFRLHNNVPYPYVMPYYFRYWADAFLGRGWCMDQVVWRDLPGHKIFQPHPPSKEGRWFWDGVRWFHLKPGSEAWMVFEQDDASSMGIATVGDAGEVVAEQKPSILPVVASVAAVVAAGALVWLRSR